MILNEVLYEIIAIEERLMYGEIQFSYDKLASAMKLGHPADILDEIISEIFFDVMEGKEPEKEKVENILNGLKRFKSSFKVKELTKPINDLRNYINERS